MEISVVTADLFIGSLVEQAKAGLDALSPTIERVATPIYVTDAEGTLTHFNAACQAFAGRAPEVGKDRWCVTWKLFAIDGSFMPHEQCPMAKAIKHKIRLRGAYADAERPDGTRIRFTPFPTPLFDCAGVMIGAVNILLEVSDSREIGDLLASAERCRRLARTALESQTKDKLNALAAEHERTALDLVTDYKSR